MTFADRESGAGADQRRPVRIAVVGSSGSGKTSVARELRLRLGLAHVELDSMHWEPNWTPASDTVMRDRVAAALAADGWVVDGNYSLLHDLTLGRAQLLVWLDYSLGSVLRQLLGRTIRRSLRREELWNGNRESLAKAFFSRESILLWLLRSFRRNRRRYRELTSSDAYPELQVVHLRTPDETRAWIEEFAPLQEQQLRS